MKKVSLEDVANSLGVSKTVVSLVLNQKAAAYGISLETSRRVLRRAQELNYLPNETARALRTGRSHLIGLIVSDISDAFYARVSRSIEHEAGLHNYRLMLCSSDENPEKEIQLIRALKERQGVDGLIISSSQQAGDLFKALKKERFPFVLLDRFFPELKSNCVKVDDCKGAAQLVEIMLRNGAKNPCMLTVEGTAQAKLHEREEGYKKALLRRSIAFEPLRIREIDPNALYAQVKHHLEELFSGENRPDGIFAVNQDIATACLEVIRQMGLRIPGEVSLVGFDDSDRLRFHGSLFTTALQPVELIGRNAVQLLLQDINRVKKITGKRHLVLPTRTVIGQSCGSR